MKPFENALIQSILDEYDEIINEESAILNQNSHGKVKTEIERNIIDAEKIVVRWSLWVDTESRIIYSTPHHGTKQFFFRDEKSQMTCIKLLTMQGYLFNE